MRHTNVFAWARRERYVISLQTNFTDAQEVTNLQFFFPNARIKILKSTSFFLKLI